MIQTLLYYEFGVLCTVVSLFESGQKLGVELECNGGRLVAEIVPEAARELGIVQGGIIHAAFKASAFRRLSTLYTRQDSA